MPKQVTIFTEAELQSAANEAFRETGLTQQQAADKLAVRQSSISLALKTVGARYSNLQVRIIELAGWEVDGPLWRVKR